MAGTARVEKTWPQLRASASRWAENQKILQNSRGLGAVKKINLAMNNDPHLKIVIDQLKIYSNEPGATLYPSSFEYQKKIPEAMGKMDPKNYQLLFQFTNYHELFLVINLLADVDGVVRLRDGRLDTLHRFFESIEPKTKLDKYKLQQLWEYHKNEYIAVLGLGEVVESQFVVPPLRTLMEKYKLINC